MKQLLILAVAFICGTAAIAQQKATDVSKVNTEKYDFGKIKQGVPVSTYFEITNTSDKPLVIENAWGSCGCTTPEVPKEPIAPGATSKLKVNYNAAAMNHFEKDVFIKFAGIQDPRVVKITGEVLDENAYNAYLKENGGAKKTSVETKTTTKQTKTKTSK
jgi:hypothetical protein